MKSKTVLINNDLCSGCGACYEVCHTKAIYFDFDERGFLKPFIDTNKCVNCLACAKVCPSNQKNIVKNNIKTYCLRSKNNFFVNESRSGAFFYELALLVLSKNGVVCGCVLNDDLYVEHIIANKIDDLNKMRGSKYVKSDLKQTFIECLDYLKNNRTVLYSGSPCQIAGLLSFLKYKKVDTSNLITCDFFCYGAPSHSSFKKICSVIEKKHKSKIVNINFRDKKRFGWKEHIETIYFKNKKTISKPYYSNAFQSKLLFDSLCYQCPYKTIYRSSDFTMGDAWGIEKTNSVLNDNRGASILIIQNSKANDIFELIKNKFIFEKVDVKYFLQPSMYESVKKPDDYVKFWKKFKHNPEKTIQKKWVPNKLQILKNKIKSIFS